MKNSMHSSIKNCKKIRIKKAITWLEEWARVYYTEHPKTFPEPLLKRRLSVNLPHPSVRVSLILAILHRNRTKS